MSFCSEQASLNQSSWTTFQAAPAEEGVEIKYRGDARGNWRADGFGSEFNSRRLHHF